MLYLQVLNPLYDQRVIERVAGQCGAQVEELFTVPGKIRSASRAYRYMDFVYWACITDNFRLLQDQKQLSAVLQRQITSETLGRCLISGVVAQ